MPIKEIKIQSSQYRLLERLTNTAGVSGDEGDVRKIVLEEVESYADQVHVDALGNVLVFKKGSQRDRLKVMVAAHMDEGAGFREPAQLHQSPGRAHAHGH